MNRIIGKSGNSIIHQHITQATVNTVALLLDNGGHKFVNHQNQKGDTPAHILVKKRMSEYSYLTWQQSMVQISEVTGWLLPTQL